MPTVLGLCYAAIAVVLLMRGSYHWILALAIAAPVGVIVSLGAGNSVPVFYFFGLLAMAGALIGSLRHKGTGPKANMHGAALLLLFVLWAGVVTAIAPSIFQGIPVLIARGGIDNQLADPGELAYTTSNVAQMAYLIIGVGVVFFLGKAKKLTPGFLSIALGSITIVCFARLVAMHASIPFPDGFFDNSTTVSYIESFDDGTQRFRGVFAEPSELGTSSLVASVYFATRFKWVAKRRKLPVIALIGMAIANMWYSTASTALVASVLILGMLVFSGFNAFVFRGAKVNPWLVITGCVAAGVAVLFIPGVIEKLTASIDSKIGTSSYNNRTGADLFSLDLLSSTFGFGTGLGSNRPSSIFPMLLSCVGIVGTVLFVAACLVLMRRAWALPEFRPTVWAFIALMVTKSVAGPNLSEPLIWLCLGVMAHAAWRESPDLAGSSAAVLPDVAGKPVQWAH